MRLSWFSKSLALWLSLTMSACAAIQAERQAQERKQQAFVQRVDFAHIWVTTGEPPADKPYSVLGEVTYVEPFTPDAIDSGKQRDLLKRIGYERWPGALDALIDEKSEVSADGSKVTVSARAIRYQSSADREALHHMNEGLVASPSGY